MAFLVRFVLLIIKECVKLNKVYLQTDDISEVLPSVSSLICIGRFCRYVDGERLLSNNSINTFSLPGPKWARSPLGKSKVVPVEMVSGVTGEEEETTGTGNLSRS